MRTPRSHEKRERMTWVYVHATPWRISTDSLSPRWYPLWWTPPLQGSELRDECGFLIVSLWLFQLPTQRIQGVTAILNQHMRGVSEMLKIVTLSVGSTLKLPWSGRYLAMGQNSFDCREISSVFRPAKIGHRAGSNGRNYRQKHARLRTPERNFRLFLQPLISPANRIQQENVPHQQ